MLFFILFPTQVSGTFEGRTASSLKNVYTKTETKQSVRCGYFLPDEYL